MDDVAEVRFENGAPPVFRGAPGKVLHLPGEQRLTGVFLGLEKSNLILRTGWADRLLVPRGAATALTHLPGWRPICVDDFQGKLSAWTIQGELAAKASAVRMHKPGQSLSCVLPTPIAEGRIGVNFRADGPLAGARWRVEARFAVKGGDRVLSVTVAGDSALAVDAGGLAGTLQRVAPAPGWRRLLIDFRAGSLSIRCDDAVLWYSLKEGPGGPLRQVRLTCDAPDKPSALRGEVAFSDFVLERAVPEHRRPPAEPGQDELWLASGDQLFGEVVCADAKSVELKGRFGLHRFAWTDLRGWFPKKRPAPPPAVARGPAVRLWLRSGLRPALDVLEGNLRAMDAKQLTLQHALLGEMSIPRGWLVRLRPLARGQ